VGDFVTDPYDFAKIIGEFKKSLSSFYAGSLEQTSKQNLSQTKIPPVPEFGPIIGVAITLSIIGVIVISRRFPNI
jgi:hypothetical protein